MGPHHQPQGFGHSLESLQRAQGFVAIPWVQLCLAPFLLVWKMRLGGGRSSVRKVLSSPLLLSCSFSKPGESSHWETCSFPRCNDTLICASPFHWTLTPRWTHSLAALLVHLKLYSNLDFPTIQQTPWQANLAICIPRFHKGGFVLSRQFHAHSPTDQGSVVKHRWALGPLSCPSPSPGPCRTNPKGMCSFPSAAWEPGSKTTLTLLEMLAEIYSKKWDYSKWAFVWLFQLSIQSFTSSHPKGNKPNL